MNDTKCSPRNVSCKRPEYQWLRRNKTINLRSKSIKDQLNKSVGNSKILRLKDLISNSSNK